MVKDSNLVSIESKQGVTIYGRVQTNQKLGQFEVHSDFLGHNGVVYQLLTEAEIRMNVLIGVKTK